MSHWTLTIDGTEKTLADWGVSSAKRHRVSLAVSSLRLIIPAQSIDSDLIPIDSAATLRRARELDANGAWTGGVIWFHGQVREIRPTLAAAAEAFAITIVCPWYWLRLTYQQQWTFGLLTNVFLFKNPDYGADGHEADFMLLNAGEQIRDIIEFAIAQGAPFQLMAGDIPPATYLPISQQRDITCEAAIRECLSCNQDIVSWFDFTTVDGDGDPLPTLHFGLASALPETSLTLGADTLIDAPIEALTELQVSAVQLNFEYLNTVAGVSSRAAVVQYYPLAAWDPVNLRLKSEYALDALVQTIDLEGETRTYVTQNLATEEIDPDSAEWWKRRMPGLRGANIRNLSITATSTPVTDRLGTTVASYEHYEIITGQLLPWMLGPDGLPMRYSTGLFVRATATYDTVQDGTETIRDHVTIPLYWEIKVACNRDTAGATVTYSTLSELQYAEPVPVDPSTGKTLAQWIYESRSRLYHRGSLSIVEDECSAPAAIGQLLNLLGGRSAWATMQALVQETVEDIGSGRTDITIGFPPHLSVNTLVAMFRWSRQRRIWINPLVQTDASAQGGANQLALSDKQPNSVQHEGPKKWTTFAVDETLWIGNSLNGLRIRSLGDITWYVNGVAHILAPTDTSLCDGNTPVTRKVLRT